ncbi:DUF2971 domain-containing protein [Scatolibacter rhodanostii]|uniref:DUF2971 domain-containing protein n=1 Tax=Scatolibacter rhodanostii TaxID=2014781 RepID=UPI000C077894|nr:DUF2971 domain-containing protein [Scatolibacter rhodanostii]
MDEILYHYCSVESFLNIIRSSQFWLFDVLKSNDIKECTWIKQKINSEIEKTLTGLGKELVSAWRFGCSLGDNKNLPTLNTYVTCFTALEDSLSQWRGYAQDGTGLAIGVSKKYLQSANEVRRPHVRFDEVRYTQTAQKKLINKIVNQNIKKMEQKTIVDCAIEFHNDYKLDFAFYKNPNFKEEKEWRLAILDEPKSQMSSNANLFKPLSQSLTFENCSFQCANNQITTYTPMNFNHIKQEFIKKIIIGPKCRVTIADVVSLLSTFDYYKSVGFNEHKPIPIIYSNSSYR